VNVKPAVDPAVTAAAVRSTVEGEQTAAGFVIVTTGVLFTVTVTGCMAKQPEAGTVPLI
jgi:hypothetical protein